VTTTIQIELRGAGGERVDLWRTLNSHGFADLPPLVLDEAGRTLELTLPTPRGRARRVRIGRSSRQRASVTVLGPPAAPKVGAALAAGVRHILRLDQDLSEFYRRCADDPDLAWVATEGAGRMLRSPTVFEDVVKTICTTNCSWGLTTKMVNALVTELGEPAVGGDGPLSHAFPTPGAMAAQPERFYRNVVRAGYRSAYLRALARSVAAGHVDLESLPDEERSDDDLAKHLQTLPGVGPYAAAHIMMTIGRNSRLILDSWTRPKYARLTGARRPVADRTIERRFRPFGDHAGLAFWLFVTRDWVT
jgi:3-methyladenine DNA glycosylase/8-oxoguanine DNA glycosylase